MIQRLFLNEAINQAMKSDMNSNHGAILVRRGKIVGKGYNRYVNSNCDKIFSIHAEVSAIKNALKKVHPDELKMCELIIIRVNNENECLNSKPCEKCSKIINMYNIRKVYHS
jgi:tRNA(Arg) A34 adenosine deaminase TadA